MNDEFKILRLNKKDLGLFIKLVELLNEVFEEYHTIASEEQLKKLLTKPEFYPVVAIANNVVVGGLKPMSFPDITMIKVNYISTILP